MLKVKIGDKIRIKKIFKLLKNNKYRHIKSDKTKKMEFDGSCFENGWR